MTPAPSFTEEGLFVPKATKCIRSSAASTCSLSLSDLNSIKQRASEDPIAQRRKLKKQQRLEAHQASKQRVSQWNNTFQASVRRKEEEKQRRRQQEELLLQQLDDEEAKHRETQRREVLSRAAELYFHEDESVQTLQSKMIALETQSDWKKQLDYKKMLAAQEEQWIRKVDCDTIKRDHDVITEEQKLKMEAKMKQKSLHKSLTSQLDECRDRLSKEHKSRLEYEQKLLEETSKKEKEAEEQSRKARDEKRSMVQKGMKEFEIQRKQYLENQKRREEAEEEERKRRANEKEQLALDIKSLHQEKQLRLTQHQEALHRTLSDNLKNLQKEADQRLQLEEQAKIQADDAREAHKEEFQRNLRSVIVNSRNKQCVKKERQRQAELEEEKLIARQQMEQLEQLNLEAKLEEEENRRKRENLARKQRDQALKKLQKSMDCDDRSDSQSKMIEDYEEQLINDCEKKGLHVSHLKRRVNCRNRKPNRLSESQIVLL
ncbi:hypothetical protein GEMRC1_011479 [Eukaryota sp. GEM-RC1]